MKPELHNYVIDKYSKDGTHVLQGKKRYGKEHAERICEKRANCKARKIV
jgi:hypothetical protein